MNGRFLIAALLLAPALTLAAPPKPYTAQYEVRRNGEMLGKAVVTFNALPNGRFAFDSNTTGSEGLAAIAGVSVNEHSLLRWNGAQPETISYTYKQQMAWKTRERGIQIDAAAGRVISTDKDRRYNLDYRPGVIDRHAVTVALMQDLASGKTGDFLFTVPDKDELSTQRYRSSASERITTALGMQRAIRVDRVRESDGGRTTTIWFGQDKNFVPLRVLQQEPDGDTVEMNITSIR